MARLVVGRSGETGPAGDEGDPPRYPRERMVIRRPTRWPRGIVGVGAGSLLMIREELPWGSPHIDDSIAGMFRHLGHVGGRLDPMPDAETDPSKLASIAEAERRTLLQSLSTTISRSSYHRQRFWMLVRELEDRRARTGLGAGHDDAARLAVFEAVAMLGAVRGAVDEIVFIAARRSGGSGLDTDRWQPAQLITIDVLPADRHLEELELLRESVTWFRELNDYRNALVHRGSRETIGTGFYPRGELFPEATDPESNVFLVPDRPSTRNFTRPHLWTYHEHARLEDLVDRTWHGFVAVLTRVGAAWGGVPSPPGSAPLERRPTMMLRVEQPAFFVARDETFYVGLFSSPERARSFVRDFGSPQDPGPVVPVRACRIDGASRYYLSVPSGSVLTGAPRDRWVKFAVDPTCDPQTKAVAYRRELGALPMRLLLDEADVGILLEIPGEAFPGLPDLFVHRVRRALRAD